MTGRSGNTVFIVLSILTFTLVLPMPGICGQEANQPLSDYVSWGLSNNLALQQQEFSYQQAMHSLDEAWGKYMPTLTFHARYTRAGGGRTIDFPIGDLINPVYMTLNQLLAAHGQQGTFPTDLRNEEIAFLRSEEQDTRIQLFQPLFQAGLYHNAKLQRVQVAIEKLAVGAFRRELVSRIKSGYFSWCRLVHLVELLEATRELVLEHVRISESLVTNGKVTADVVHRARAELTALDQQLVEARLHRDLAVSYVNVLLNRPLEEALDLIDEAALPSSHDPVSVDEMWGFAERREEMRQARFGIDAARRVIKLAKSAYMPSVGGAVDYGFEGETYRFSAEDDFWMASVVLQWNLFKGFQDKAALDRAELELRKRDLSLREASQKIALQILEAARQRDVKKAAIVAASDRVDSTVASFDIISRKFREGSASQIEYLDARTAKTQAETALLMARYDYQISLAVFERVAAIGEVE